MVVLATQPTSESRRRRLAPQNCQYSVLSSARRAVEGVQEHPRNQLPHDQDSMVSCPLGTVLLGNLPVPGPQRPTRRSLQASSSLPTVGSHLETSSHLSERCLNQTAIATG